MPKVTAPTENVTAPSGVPPLGLFTVAVTEVSCPKLMLPAAAETDILTAAGVISALACHAVTMLNTSTDPSPVTWSYPGPAS